MLLRLMIAFVLVAFSDNNREWSGIDMKVINLLDHNIRNEWVTLGKNDQYLLVASREEFKNLEPELGIFAQPEKEYANRNENIRFESRENYDFLSFAYFESVDSKFEYEILSIYCGNNFVALVHPEEGYLHQNALLDFLNQRAYATTEESKVAFAYYKLLNSFFTKMFEAMFRFENKLLDMETSILLKKRQYQFEQIVELRSATFQIEKAMRLLLYVGDLLVDNDNALIPEDSLRYFKNIDMRINRMYEFSKSIHEMSDHLMQLYNTTMNEKSNSLLNKLTVFTFFAAPLTILTGIY
ncbi:MAG: CorA family divalent cation transporter, partial [Anaerovoracaceae bacterium]